MKQKVPTYIVNLISSFFLSKIMVYLLIVLSFLLLILLMYRRRTERYIKNYSIRIFLITASMGLILYFIGYTENGNSVLISLLRAMFSTARMFGLNDDYSVICNSINDNSIVKSFGFLLIFWSVHVGALVSITFAILSIFGRKVIEELLLVLKFSKKIYVIFGANSKSLCLANSLMKSNNRLVIIIDEKANDYINEKIRDMGAILIKEKPFDRGVIDNKLLKKVGLLNKQRKMLIELNLLITKKLKFQRLLMAHKWLVKSFSQRLNKKIEIFLLEEDETYNLAIAKSLIDIAKKNKVPIDRMCIFIQLNDVIILRNIKEILNNNVNYEVNIINEADLATRKLMQDYPIFNTLDIDTDTATIRNKAITILIIGFGKIGREVLFKSICNAQFISKDKKNVPFNALIVDSKWQNKSWQFRNVHQSILKEYPGIVFEPYSSESEEFYDLLNRKIEEINYFVIATEDDKSSLELAKNIQTVANNKKINWEKKIMAVHMRNQLHLFNETDENTIFKNIKFFGEYENTFTEDVIVNEINDVVARKINEYYNIENSAEVKKEMNYDNWEKLDLFEKNSNRAAATHMITKLTLLGYEVIKNNQISDFSENLTLDEYISYVKLENILRIEHLRWNAFHFVNGWTNFSDEMLEMMRDSNENEMKHKDLKNRKHACLVSWEKLIYISDIFRINDSNNLELEGKYPNIKGFQILDLKQILNIPKFLNFAGVCVKKN